MIVTVVDPRPSINVQVSGGPTVNVAPEKATTTLIVTATGPQGPAGAGNAGGYTHTQVTASTIWTIQHNLGYAVAPTVLDSNGQVTFGWTPAWSNGNVLILNFPVPFAGTAHVS